MIIGKSSKAGRCLFIWINVIIIYEKLSHISAEEEIPYIQYEPIGLNTAIECKIKADKVWWMKNGTNVTNSDTRYIPTKNQELDADDTVIDYQPNFKIRNFLNITNLDKSDRGNYSCYTETESFLVSLEPVVPARVIEQSPARVEVNVSMDTQIFCIIEAYPMDRYQSYIKWTRPENIGLEYDWKKMIKKRAYVKIDETKIKMTLDVNSASKKDNGTYYCDVDSRREHLPTGTKDRAEISIFVLEAPQVSIDYVKPVGAHKIFFNWTIMDGNSPVLQYHLQFMKEVAGENPSYKFYGAPIGGQNISYVVDNLDPNSNYKFKLSAKNKNGVGNPDESISARTLTKDPVFVPVIEAKGNTHSTVTIGWGPPPTDVLEYIQYYELIVSHANDSSSIKEEAVHPQNSRNLPYMFDNLETSTEYIFKVRACSELTKSCGNWSEPVRGTTSDGTSSEPMHLSVTCDHFNITRISTVSVLWDPPQTARGIIMKYQVELQGLSEYRNDFGVRKNDTLLKLKHVEPGQESRLKTLFEGVSPNTNYTVKVSAITRSKKLGEYAIASCVMPPTVPDDMTKEKFTWGRFKSDKGDWIFKLFLPRISERNGPICCYRIYMVRVTERNQPLEDLPENLAVLTYHDVHAVNNTKGGAYIAEVLSTKHLHREVYLGDGENIDRNRSLFDHNKSCRSCLHSVTRVSWRRQFKPTTTTPSPILEGMQEIALDAEEEETSMSTPVAMVDNKAHNRRRRRRRQHYSENLIAEEAKTPNPSTSVTIDGKSFEIYDGPLDYTSFYTGFVEVIVQSDKPNPSKDDILSTYSSYFDMMPAGAPASANSDDDELTEILNFVVQILTVLIIIVLILLVALCFLHRHYTKHAGQGDEIISLRDSLSRALCGGRSNHNHLIGSVSSKPPDIAPISKADLPQAFAVRHKDSDYGFQHEFEMLPDRFNDRTTKYSDAKENVYKNRYPDIKSYDQSRVRLSMVNSILGSDYINANFVVGYKERKKFICAQGPMESTITDFWRMIWEQHLEIIVMLTNLEEYNKSKCAKYWPEKLGDTTQFGDIAVTFDDENRYSDYLIRELKVVKRNENSEEEDERRTITQYHYLAWKDFMAPEHPHGIIKFIRQINAVYSVQRGPILVHCSAGVGRTGTLVALDSLMQQVHDEGQVSIFNTVCDLRHQRNFLVQSLKQYIFLYRSLVDIAQFGNTEIQAKDLSATIENLKLRSSDSKEQSKLEIEYEKIKTISDDTKKTCAVGSGDENRAKNRSELVIPFDRNRVILTPMPGREHSTYINSSFIEGYDNSESFIITQDPMESTIGDFWRMISEQGIKTIVMISEIGDGPRKCPRYWADDEMQLDHILVKYIQSESCPYYTRREFSVINCRSNDSIQVTQFQYNGWPTVEGEVPEVARGIIELVDQAQKHHNSEEDGYTNHGAMVVHCSLGSDRSSIFVAMCILVQQLRTERKVDICTTTRKLRSQRNMLIDSFAQYEFLHRAIVNYSDLHRLSMDSSSPDC